METSDDPISLGIMGIGTALQVGGALAQGRQAEEIGEARARIDEANAAAATRRAAVEAKIKVEQGRRLLATQTARFAAGGINVGMGSPVVVATQTKADILRDINFGLEGGDVESRAFKSSAKLERLTGESIRKRSYWQAFNAGASGAANFFGV